MFQNPADSINPNELLEVTALLLIPPVVISALEDMLLGQALFDRSLFDWRFCLSFHPLFRPFGSPEFKEALFGETGFKLFCVLRLTSAVLLALFAFWNLSFLVLPAVLLLISYAYLFYRLPYSLDGADQMVYFAVITFLVMSLGTIFSEAFIYLGAIVLSLHVGICYLTSGLAKLSSRSWRSGKALVGIMNSGEFGNRLFSQMLDKKPRLTALCSWGIISGHIFSGITILFLGGTTVILALTISFCFHLSVALFMRLNGFIFAFIATYPSVLFTSHFSSKLIIYDYLTSTFPR